MVSLCVCVLWVRAVRFMKMAFSLLAKPIQSKIIQKTLFFVSAFTSHFPFPITLQVLIHTRIIFWDPNKKGISHFWGTLFVELKEERIEKICVYAYTLWAPAARTHAPKSHEHCFLSSLDWIELLALFIWMWFGNIYTPTKEQSLGGTNVLCRWNSRN